MSCARLRSLAKAAATAVAGDTVHVKAGTYYERLVAAHSGGPGAPITFAPYAAMGGIGVGNLGDWDPNPPYDVRDITLRNNIVSRNRDFQIVVKNGPTVGNITVDHNLIWGFRGFADETRDTEYVEADPQFGDPAAGDFHLAGTSPAIDRGTPLSAPAIDFDGGLRPVGAGIDIGAFEFGATAGGGRPETPPGSRHGRRGATGAEWLVVLCALCLTRCVKR